MMPFSSLLKTSKEAEIAPRFPKVAVGVGLSYAPAMLVQKIRSAQRFPLMIWMAEQPFDTWQVGFFHRCFLFSKRVRVLYNFQVVKDLSHGFLWTKMWRWCFAFPETRRMWEQSQCPNGSHVVFVKELSSITWPGARRMARRDAYSLNMFELMRLAIFHYFPLVETCSSFSIHGNPWLVFQHGNSNP